MEHQDSYVRVAAVTSAAVVGNDATLKHKRKLLHDVTSAAKTRQHW